VLEFGGEVTLEIVLDDEDAEEIGIAAGTQDVPGERGEAEAGNRDRMKTAEGVAPAPGDCRSQQYAATGKHDCGGALRERSEAEEEAKEEKTQRTPSARICVKARNRCVNCESGR